MSEKHRTGILHTAWHFLWANWAEITKFLLVGLANYFVDLAVFNLFRLWIMPTHPVTSKVISVTVATAFSWVVNRSWTFRGKGNKHWWIEAMWFAAANVAGMIPSLLCLWVSHYLMNLTSAFADNISANVIGLILGTIVRYFFYKFLVFTGQGH